MDKVYTTFSEAEREFDKLEYMINKKEPTPSQQPKKITPMTPELEKTIMKALDDAYDRGINHAIEIVRGVQLSAQMPQEIQGMLSSPYSKIISQLKELKTKQQ